MNGLHCPTPGSLKQRHLGRLPLLIVWLLLSLSPPVHSAEVSARIDETDISLNETVGLVVELNADPATAARPDLSVLARDFEIVDRRTQSNVTRINGQRSERHSLMLRLLPRRAGDLVIPSIRVGDEATGPLQLRVTEGPGSAGEDSVPPPSGDSTGPSESSAEPEVVLEASLEPSRVRVDQQVVLTVRVLMDAPVASPRLHDPQPVNTKVLPLGEDRYQIQRDGRDLSVYERRYALFPRDEGQVEIEPLRFEGWVQTPAAEQSGMGYPPPNRQVQARSRPLSVQVLRAQRDRAADGWLPARNLTLSESGPETYRVTAGQPVQRRIGLRADGVMAADLPKVIAGAPHQFAKGRGQPRLWDERRPEGVIGTRQEVLTLTTQEPGHYRLPPVSLDWWNSAQERWETAMLPARNLVVSATSVSAPTIPVQATVTNPGDLPPPTQPVEREPTPAMAQVDPDPRRDEPATTGNLWVWIAIAFALAWVATLFGWWQGRNHGVRDLHTSTTPESEPVPGEEDPLSREVDAVRAAYQAGDAAAAREALLSWAGQVLPERSKPSNLARLAQRCPEPLRAQILMLEEAFFSPRPIPWNDQPVWERMHHFQPLPLEEPASFRRGKPIRRRAPNPDAE